MKRVSVEIDSGCIYISGAVEFDDRPGPVRDALVGMVQTWQDALQARDRSRPMEEGHLRADTDAEQMLFEIHGLILALHHDARFLRNPGAVERAHARLRATSLQRCAAPPARAARPPAAPPQDPASRLRRKE